MRKDVSLKCCTQAVLISHLAVTQFADPVLTNRYVLIELHTCTAASFLVSPHMELLQIPDERGCSDCFCSFSACLCAFSVLLHKI